MVELTVCNTTIQSRIAAKLKLELPLDANIKRFEVRRDNKWYPATAVPKKKATEIVYKEKESKKDVAVASNVGSSNAFSMELFPLPYNEEVQCRLEIMLVTKDVEALVDSIGQSAGICEKHYQKSLVASPLADGDIVKGGAIVGEAFGKTHFVCKIPTIEGETTKKAAAAKTLPRIALLWDTSASMTPTQQQMDARASRLTELVSTAKTTDIELFTFGTEIRRVGSYTKVEEALDAVNKFEYDGGSFFSELPSFFQDLVSRDKNKVDCILVMTDGVDSLSKSPAIGSAIPIPIHCIADGKTLNMNCLKSITAASMYPGAVFTSADTTYDAVVRPRVLLRSIITDQDEEAMVEEVDDGFRCVPDHRLAVINQPVGSDGILIAGILDDGGGGKTDPNLP